MCISTLDFGLSVGFHNLNSLELQINQSKYIGDSLFSSIIGWIFGLANLSNLSISVTGYIDSNLLNKNY